jgi:hypothetical protein
MTNANHVLAKEGILTAFSIAKRVTVKDVKRLKDKFKNTKNQTLEELMRKAILDETQTAIESNQIPGLILSGDKSDNEEKRLITDLTYFASIIAKKMNEKNTDKYHACYIINAIVNMLGLSENDFDEFHRRFSKYRNGDSDDGEEGDDYGAGDTDE